jgi:hypothetical protein
MHFFAAAFSAHDGDKKPQGHRPEVTPAMIAGTSAPSQETMSNANHRGPLQILLNVSKMDTGSRIQLAALIAQFAPQSAVYAANPLLKEAVDAVLQAGVTLDAASKDTDAQKQAYLASIVIRDTVQGQFDAHAAVLKASAQNVCKTEQDIQSLGLHRRPAKAAPAPLVPPKVIIAQPGKEKGSISVHALRMPGLTKYVAEICDGPTPGNFQPLPGTTARRTLVGYVSGQQYWIRYATERGVTRSAWSEPVPVVAR